MRPSSWFGVCVLCVSVAALGTACSSKDDRPPGAEDTGGASSTGGSRATAGGTGDGAGGSGITGAGGSLSSDGGASGAGGADTSTGGVPPSCAPLSDADGGLTWRDFEVGSCKPCPATELTECEQFTAAPGPRYDPASKVLTVHVAPGLTEVIGLRLEGRTTTDGKAFTFVDVDAAIEENTISFDFAGKLPDGAQGFFEGLLVGDDACGGAVDTSASLKLEIRFDAEGAADRIGCVE